MALFLRTGATSYMDDNVVSALLEIHTKSTKKWKAAAIREALKELNPLFSEYRGSQGIRANWQGTIPHFMALCYH